MSALDTLTSQNFELYAARAYNNRFCLSTDEFHQDLNTFKYLKKLVNRCLNNPKEQGDNTYRLIHNHIITIYNNFEIEAATRLLRFKLSNEQFAVILPMLAMSGYIAEEDYGDVNLFHGTLEYCDRNTLKAANYDII